MTWLTIFLWVAGIAAVLCALVGGFIIYVVTLVCANDGTDDDPWGDPSVWPRMTGDYPAGVEFRLPEPADQQHDKSDPTTDPNWPGKVRRRAF